MATAAAASIRERCCRLLLPASRSCRAALTVVSRSSTSRTALGRGSAAPAAGRRAASRAARPLARSRILAAAGPSPPDSERGSPTTISTGSYSAISGEQPVQLAVPGRHGRDRERQRGGPVAGRHPDPGVAQIQREPDAATHGGPPARPSDAPRVPCEHPGDSRRPGSECTARAGAQLPPSASAHAICRTCPIACSTAVSAAADCDAVAAAALGDVVLAAAATAQRLASRPGPGRRP